MAANFQVLTCCLLLVTTEVDACDWQDNFQVLSQTAKIQVLSALDVTSDIACGVSALLELSQLYQQTHRQVEAIQHAQLAVNQARTHKEPLLIATALVEYGNQLLYAQKDYPSVLASYTEALEIVHDKSQQHTVAVLINLAQFWVDLLEKASPRQQKSVCPECNATTLQAKAVAAFQQALTATLEFPIEDNADNLLHLAHIGYASPLKKEKTKHVVEILQHLQKLDAQMFPHQLSQANGLLGKIYVDSVRYDDAATLFRQAIFYAQQAQAADLIVRWQHHLGRVLFTQQQNHPDFDYKEAIQIYQHAIQALAEIRPQILSQFEAATVNSTGNLRDSEYAKLYLELIEMLLDMAGRNQATEQFYLFQAIDVLERFKTVELQSYYQDDCIASNKLNLSSNHVYQEIPFKLFDKIDVRDAVLYPILLSNRLEIILYSNGKLIRATPIDISRIIPLIDDASLIRNAPGKDVVMPDNIAFALGELYQWIIAPFSEHLLNVTTLVVIPDGKLRQIPFSVLYDKTTQRYLVENLAVVVTPSLTLTSKGNAQPIKKLLVNGLSEPTGNALALEHVEHEIYTLEKLAPDAHVLINQTFTKDELERTANSYLPTAVHIATHGQFEGVLKDSYLFAYRGEKLTVNDLSHLSQQNLIKEQPLELLTLSACESAKGDEYAALGLSGVAIKAGARAALASLWKVDDASTCYLMVRFYQQLLQGNLPEAQALRNAQLELLSGKYQASACFDLPVNYQHPYYWGAFILIGYETGLPKSIDLN